VYGWVKVKIDSFLSSALEKCKRFNLWERVTPNLPHETGSWVGFRGGFKVVE
jgi:hypothetical protein